SSSCPSSWVHGLYSFSWYGSVGAGHGGYPKDEMDNYPDSGHSDPTQFKESLRNQLFKVTLLSTKETP
ncbi:hypothetical protein VDS44_21900, partial [Xanthomonas campestris pv. campestris]|nr:hypothetical protein [Xanthomonas campestris pv. campestris]